MITIKNADKALKDYYLDAVTAQLNDGISPFFSAIEKNTANVYGKDVKMSIVRGTSGNVIAGAEDADLPDPYKNRYLDITVPLKNLYGTIEISDKALRASRDDSGAFVNLVNAEMEGLISSAKQNFQRMLFGDGTGALCKITSKVSDTVYKVDSVKEYFTGMVVDMAGDGITGGDLTGLYINSVNVKNSTVTFSSGVTSTVTGASLFLHGAQGHELTGLGAIFGGTTLYGYKKSDESFFEPYCVDANKKFTEEMLTDMIDHVEEHYNSKINMIICSYKSRKKIAALIANERRVVNSTDANTGFGTVTISGVPVYADKYCPDDKIMFLNTDDFCLSQLCDWEWLEDEGGKILKQVNGKAAYTATLVKYAELICKKPCGQAMLYNFEV